MSDFATITDLFPESRQPTRELEPIQKVDRTEQIDLDIEEFIETESARRVLSETATIVGAEGMDHRFRYIHATFGSGKSHLLKLIGVATGEIEGLEEQAHELANTKSGFKEFREALGDSRIDHLVPLFMNLLDRDSEDTKLPLIIFDELGRRRGYPTTRPWLLEFCWRLDIEHGLWEALQKFEHRELTLTDVVQRPSSLRPWLIEVLPQLDGAAEAEFDSAEAVESAIDDSAAAMSDDAFDATALSERLIQTKRHLEKQTGESHQFLIGLDEIAIYVGDQPRRYTEVVNTIETLIDDLNPPILGTGQWSLRDDQQNFVGEVNEEAWYAQEIELEGADTETIVRKRWLQKSSSGAEYLQNEVLIDAPEIEPSIGDGVDRPGSSDLVEAYPFRDGDLHLFRAVMQGLIKGDRETDREYIQGRALLVRVRSLFTEHGWADKPPGSIVPWDEIYDVLREDTVLVPSWASDLIGRVENTLGNDLATRTAKALFLLSQVDYVPRTAENLARLLVDDVTEDVERLHANVQAELENLADRNLIRAEAEEEPTTYTILSERDIRFWQEVAQEAAGIPEHQLRDNILEILLEADPERLTSPDGSAQRSFAGVEAVRYGVRYSIGQSLPESVPDRHDAIIVRLLVDDSNSLQEERARWQDQHGGPDGREDVLVTIELPEAIRQEVRQLVGMRTVLSGMADPRPEYQIERQRLNRAIEDDLRERLHDGRVYAPIRETTFGPYLDSIDEAVAEAVTGKFPDRKHIERSLQVDDLQAIAEFLDDQGGWPLTDGDAERLGVNQITGELDDGWREEFLDEFEGDDWVSGEQLLETIEGRRGAFLGTPEEALHALLFLLVANNDIEVRRDGERVTDLDDIARIITSRTRISNAVIGFDPDPRPEGLDELYEILFEEPPETEDTKRLVEEIAAWAKRDASTIRTVVSRVSLVFGSRHSIEEFETAIEPAFSGNELSARQLASGSVIEQARRYRKGRGLFVPDHSGAEPLWDQFEAAYQTLHDLYPSATIVDELEPYHLGTLIPSSDTIEEKLTEIEACRVDQLQSFYTDLTGDETAEDEIDVLLGEVTEALRPDSLESDLDHIEEAFDEIRFDDLRTLMKQAEEASEPLPEESIAKESVQADAQRLCRGRALLETEIDGTPVIQELREVEADLSEAHEGFITTQLQRAVNGPELPTVERAKQLLNQGARQLDGKGTGGDDQVFEGLWSKIADHEEGTIVVLDPEGHR